MGVQVTITIPDETYKKAQRFARMKANSVEETIAEAIQFPDVSDEHPLDMEMDAYLQMHVMLWEKYPQQYVAIYQQKLLDHDVDFATLHQRVREKYPNEVIWMSQVNKEPIRTIHMRSPRFLR